jgi:hypothetical protein
MSEPQYDPTPPMTPVERMEARYGAKPIEGSSTEEVLRNSAKESARLRAEGRLTPDPERGVPNSSTIATSRRVSPISAMKA